MGVVYVVYDHTWHQPFAIKTFQDEVFINNPTVAEPFMHEALIWVNLDVHQNVISARMVQQIVKKPHLFLEYVSGGDLSKWIGTSRLLQDLPQVLRFAIQLCDGMRHALSKGVKAHRDIKPQNCLITQDRTLKITDFGLAKVFDEASLAADGVPAQQTQELNLMLTWSGVAAGTPAYMAPEQFDDAKHVDVRADIYSFGVMLYEMVIGRRPFAGRTWQELERAHRMQPPPALMAQNTELRKIVDVCLAKRPENRYEDFRQVRDELAQVYQQLTGEDAPQAIAGEKLTAVHLLDIGVNLDALGRTEEALACYDRLLKDDSSFELAWINKGVILTESGRAEDAIACFNRALKITPHYDMAWLKKGRALDKLGRREEADACYDRALQINPITGSSKRRCERHNASSAFTQRSELSKALRR
jgi:serine/threonine protein kinase